MTRLHLSCPSCTCGQEAPVQVDTSAPFYPLVVLVDAIAHHEMLLRSAVTKARKDVA